MSKITDTVKKTAINPQKAIINVLDQDGNGRIDITDVILLAFKAPGVRVKRNDFLRKELFKNHPDEIVELAVQTTPAKAGISREEVDKLADEVIKYERNAVSGISLALGVGGGATMIATIPADVGQYYGYMLRAAQKLLYLYGFPEIMTNKNDLKLDTETINCLTLCLGIMNGVAGANNYIKGMSNALASGVEKQLINMALTRGTLYPIIENIAKWFGVRMTQEVFAGFFEKSIPVVGGAIGCGLTYATFKPCCYKLKESLRDTFLSNPDNHKISEEEQRIYEEIKNGTICIK